VSAPSARSLILDLLSTLSGGSMPVAALVEAGQMLGIQGGSLRVALARLLADGRIERDGRGLYRLGAASAPVDTLVRSWRHLERRIRPWSGTWLAVHLPGRVARGARGRSVRALRLLGFAALSPGLHLRPANLREDVGQTRATLLALRLEEAALTCEMQALDDASTRRAHTLWNRRALVAGYRELRAELRQSGRRLAELAPEVAMSESFLLGGRAIQRLVQDPLLPEEILASDERTALVEALLDYDARGRACWAPFLERQDVPHRGAPQDTRAVANLQRLRA
jgi:phenylacetic acid degradation operon negative regulatory protein